MKKLFTTLQGEPVPKLKDWIPNIKKSRESAQEQKFLESLFPAVNHQRITLPEPELLADGISKHRLLSSLKIEETISMIYISMQNDDLDEAERIFHRTWRTNPIDLKLKLDHLFADRFIELFLQKQLNYESQMNIWSRSYELRALEWFNNMENYGWKPQVSTFSLFISYYLEQTRPDDAKDFVIRFQKAGNDIADLLNYSIFSDAGTKEMLETLLFSMGFEVQAKNELNEFLMSAFEDTLSIAAKEKYSQQLTEKNMEEINPANSTGIFILRETLNGKQNFSNGDKYNQQLWLEARAYSAAKEQFEIAQKKMPEDSRTLKALPQDIINNWIAALLKSLENVLENPEKDLFTVLPFLKLLPLDVVARITITELLRTCSDKGWDREVKNAPTGFGTQPALVFAMNISKALQIEHNLQQLNSKKNLRLLNIQKNVHKIHSAGKLFNMTLRKAVTELARHESRQTKWKPNWGATVCTKIGSFLLHETLKIANLKMHIRTDSVTGQFEELEIPAFEHKIVSIKDGKLGVIAAHPALYDLMANTTGYIAPWSLPMLVPPLPWLTNYSGGYLQHRFPLVRTVKNDEHVEYLKAADEAGHLTTMMRALDILGATPWVINRKVFSVAVHFWNQKVAVAGLPSDIEPDDVPRPPDIETNVASAKKYKEECRRRQRVISNNFSERCSVNYKLDIARALIGETIYFPHNVDFRGRAYPLPPHLHHMGDDLCRGLLLFQKKKPLGIRGLFWLKVHVSNLYGFDKATFEERVEFTENSIELIFDSARNPIAGKKWWLQGENPWQLLSACMELEKALQLDDPTEFESNLHIHQDGSCNGLQHYAALGGDVLGAQAVNLSPSDRPGDVYSGVANTVQKRVDIDAENGNQIALKVKHRINRKLVKQTVMTNTYGVTWIGARDQIRSRLQEAAAVESKETALSNDEILECANYLTGKVFEGMTDMFEGARTIQLWLNEVAKLITQSVPKKRLPKLQRDIYDSALAFGLITPEIVENRLKNIKESLLDAAEEELKIANSSTTQIEEDENVLDEKDFIYLKSKKTPLKLTAMTWTTPLGFPIVQPYRKVSVQQVFKIKKIKTYLQTFNIQERQRSSPVNSMKQSSAFPPNFVHSLDASHMMLSCITCDSKKLTFAAVHDSYWTHACDVDEMSAILREAFVKLHSKNIMERLKEECQARYGQHRILKKIELNTPEKREIYEKMAKSLGLKSSKNKKAIEVWAPFTLPQLPKRGSFDVQNVLHSPYFFH